MMIKITTCPTCGSAVQVQTSNEGTSCHMPLESIYKRALQLIAAKEGMCIYGKPEFIEMPESAYADSIKEQFQDGSSKAFDECAKIARAALDDLEILDI